MFAVKDISREGMAFYSDRQVDAGTHLGGFELDMPFIEKPVAVSGAMVRRCEEHSDVTDKVYRYLIVLEFDGPLPDDVMQRIEAYGKPVG